MDKEEATSHYLTEDPPGGCRGMRNGCLIALGSALVVIVAIVITIAIRAHR